MKKSILFFCLTLLFSYNGLSQKREKYKLNVKSDFGYSIFNPLENIFKVPSSYDSYNYLELKMGINLPLNKSALNINVSYRLERISYGIFWNSHTYHSHNLGIELDYLFNKDRWISPLLSMQFLTQIHASYKLQFITNSLSDTPDSYIETNDYYENQTKYYSKFYIGSPFISNILGGVAFRPFKGFHINLSAGFGFRVIRTKYAEWSSGVWKDKEPTWEEEMPNKEKLLSDKPIRNHFFMMLNFQLGISYNFSFHKNSTKKTKTP